MSLHVSALFYSIFLVKIILRFFVCSIINKTNLHVYITLEFVTAFGAVMYAGNVCIFTFLKKLKFVIIEFFTRVLVSKLDTFIIKPLQSRSV